jgi:putative lysine transport system ATP-binding protein
MMKNIIEISNAYKAYLNNKVLQGINLNINSGEVVALIGESGSGKSTLLRCINGLETLDSGTIKFNNLDITAINENQLRTNIGMVFQQFNLFNNMNVLKNCTIGLIKVKKLSRAEAETIAIEKLTLVGMGNFINSSVDSLSGGQKQRVAIARSLCLNPDVLLFDEPTSALDPKNVNEVLNVIANLAKANMTLIIVTHEMKFAREVANRIVYMDEGIICEQGSPTDLFDNPQNPKTKAFLKYS